MRHVQGLCFSIASMDFRRLVSIGAIYEISEIKKRWQGGVFRERERESDKFLLVLLCEKKKTVCCIQPYVRRLSQSPANGIAYSVCAHVTDQGRICNHRASLNQLKHRNST